jgi:GTP cyclohydrolase FolE2
MGATRSLSHTTFRPPGPTWSSAFRAQGCRASQRRSTFGWGKWEQVVAAEIDCTVDLAASQKGVHMSRFPELFEEAIERVVIGEALVIEALAEHIAQHIVERQRALRAEVRIRARYPLERRTPGDRPRDAGDGRLDRDRGRVRPRRAPRRRRRGNRHERLSLRPGARAQRRDRATAGGGLRRRRRRRILELVPLATHNQRGRGHALRRVGQQLNAERLVDIVESSMSSPVYELLKRPDELFVVEHAHLQPRFVEDSVRLALATTLERFPDLDDADFLYSRQVNLETIHSHDVLAERYGTVAELRGELDDGTTPARHTNLEDWLHG